MSNQPFLVLDLSKGWSPEARAAAAEARRANQGPVEGVKVPRPASLVIAMKPNAVSQSPAIFERQSYIAAHKGRELTFPPHTFVKDDETYTEVETPAEANQTVRFRPPKEAKGIFLRTQHKAIDYNADLLKEKYGPVRGEKMYMDSIDSNRFSGNPSAGPFLMHNQIQKEKLAMMSILGKKGTPENHNYQGLYQKYLAKTHSTRGENVVKS